ncbi:hypothetical protein, partial [Oenococcus oeni]|uniref:hypothetical protein n=1 Tax=Oenococcus oeni TaxID=1247 RepID=UPI001C5BF454
SNPNNSKYDTKSDKIHLLKIDENPISEKLFERISDIHAKEDSDYEKRIVFNMMLSLNRWWSNKGNLEYRKYIVAPNIRVIFELTFNWARRNGKLGLTPENKFDNLMEDVIKEISESDNLRKISHKTTLSFNGLKNEFLNNGKSILAAYRTSNNGSHVGSLYWSETDIENIAKKAETFSIALFNL